MKIKKEYILITCDGCNCSISKDNKEYITKGRTVDLCSSCYKLLSIFARNVYGFTIEPVEIER